MRFRSIEVLHFNNRVWKIYIVIYAYYIQLLSIFFIPTEFRET